VQEWKKAPIYSGICVYGRYLNLRFGNPQQAQENPVYELKSKRCPILTRKDPNKDGEIHLLTKQQDTELPIVQGVVCEYHCESDNCKSSLCQLSLSVGNSPKAEACSYRGLPSQSVYANQIELERRKSSMRRRRSQF